MKRKCLQEVVSKIRVGGKADGILEFRYASKGLRKITKPLQSKEAQSRQQNCPLWADFCRMYADMQEREATDVECQSLRDAVKRVISTEGMSFRHQS